MRTIYEVRDQKAFSDKSQAEKYITLYGGRYKEITLDPPVVLDANNLQWQVTIWMDGTKYFAGVRDEPTGRKTAVKQIGDDKGAYIEMEVSAPDEITALHIANQYRRNLIATDDTEPGEKE